MVARSGKLLVSASVAAILFLLFGVGEVVFDRIPGADMRTKAAFHRMVVAALAPWYYAVEVPAGPMLLFAVHTTAKAHLLRWAVFSLVSGAIWFATLWAIEATFRRLKPRPHWLPVSGFLVGLSPALEIGPAVAQLATRSVHGADPMQGPWWWLARMTGWPGVALVRLTVGSGWIPPGATMGSSSAEYFAYWGLLLLANVLGWTALGFFLSRLCSRGGTS